MIDFKKIPEVDGVTFPGGVGTPTCRAFDDGVNKICITRVKPGGTIGEHQHKDTSEVIYVISGVARYILDGKEEILHPGDVHYCPKGHTHQGFNIGDVDLVIYCVISHVI